MVSTPSQLRVLRSCETLNGGEGSVADCVEDCEKLNHHFLKTWLPAPDQDTLIFVSALKQEKATRIMQTLLDLGHEWSRIIEV